MDIKFNGKYKAVTSFEINDLPSLTIITGRNGVGKTQLLELLNGQYYAQDANKNVEFTPKIKNKILLKSHFQLSSIEPISFLKLQDIFFNSPNNTNSYSKPHIDKLKIKFGKQNIWGSNNKTNDLNCLLDKFSYQDFFNNYKNDINEPNFGLEVLFFIYYCQYTLKKLDYLDKDISINNEKIFNDLGAAPWDIVNEFLDLINSPYKINNPIKELGNNLMGQYIPAFIDLDRGIKLTKLSDLSSGENIMISLAFWLYAARNQNIFPDLILLDEPDAHLHPEFIKQFLNILQNICTKYNSHIIMTTHSPVTVALAPKNSVYEMQKKDNPRIVQSQSILSSINMLCSGLLVFQPNKKYIITEDEIDSKVYNAIYKILSRNNLLKIEPKLEFLPISNKYIKTTGGKDKVIEFVSKIQDINKDNGIIVKGLLDADDKNLSINNENISYINRYSIENYLLDPINVFASVLRTYNIEGVDISYGEEGNIKLLDANKLQLIVNNICSNIKNILPEEIKNSNTIKSIKYINGKEINCPDWIFNMKGHDLMLFCQKAFPCVNKLIYSDNLLNSLKRTEMIPEEFIQIFNNIINDNVPCNIT